GVLHAVYGVFFFFQAEDGIRDRNVTGVQTCALPIYIADPLGLAGLRTFMLDYFLPLWTWLRWPVIFGLSQMLIALLYHVAPNVRSEERRVGKERRSRWGGEQYKQKRPRERDLSQLLQ